KRVLLELGGKSPLIVRHDADLYLAAKVGLSNFTFHAGQGCALCTRHLVHRSLHDKYVEKVASLGSQLVIGDPAEPATQMGPLIRPQAAARTDGTVVDPVAQGA